MAGEFDAGATARLTSGRSLRWAGRRSGDDQSERAGRPGAGRRGGRPWPGDGRGDSGHDRRRQGRPGRLGDAGARALARGWVRSGGRGRDPVSRRPRRDLRLRGVVLDGRDRPRYQPGAAGRRRASARGRRRSSLRRPAVVQPFGDRACPRQRGHRPGRARRGLPLRDDRRFRQERDRPHRRRVRPPAGPRRRDHPGGGDGGRRHRSPQGGERSETQPGAARRGPARGAPGELGVERRQESGHLVGGAVPDLRPRSRPARPQLRIVPRHGAPGRPRAHLDRAAAGQGERLGVRLRPSHRPPRRQRADAAHARRGGPRPRRPRRAPGGELLGHHRSLGGAPPRGEGPHGRRGGSPGDGEHSRACRRRFRGRRPGLPISLHQ